MLPGMSCQLRRRARMQPGLGLRSIAESPGLVLPVETDVLVKLGELDRVLFPGVDQGDPGLPGHATVGVPVDQPKHRPERRARLHPAEVTQDASCVGLRD